MNYINSLDTAKKNLVSSKIKLMKLPKLTQMEDKWKIKNLKRGEETENIWEY